MLRRNNSLDFVGVKSITTGAVVLNRHSGIRRPNMVAYHHCSFYARSIAMGTIGRVVIQQVMDTWKH